VLEPGERGTLLEALRPPPGYTVESAIATTFSLDLIALLTAPLSFSLFDRLASHDSENPERLDSLALLQAVRRHAERLVVFCEPGYIALAQYRSLLVYLEQCVMQVRSPNETGVFHPKLWVTRLTSDEGPVRYRVLCSSRNLTFDRSWDTLLTLDGELIERTRAIGQSRPLAEFVRALPGLALREPTPEQRALVERMADELLRVRFEVPEPFDSLEFCPLGHSEKRKDPFEGVRVDRLLVVSPFLAPERLRALGARGGRHVLISRQDSLAAIPSDVLSAYSEVHTLHDVAENLDDATELAASAPTESEPHTTTHGLHAKLYVADDGRNAHVWTGSANASDAAFSTNVEFLVHLAGTKGKVGTEAFLGDDRTGLRSLLVPYAASAELLTVAPEEQVQQELLRAAVREISRAPWEARVTSDAVGADGRVTYSVVVALDTQAPVPECRVRVWPIALPADRALTLDDTRELRFEACSFEALTEFFGFVISLADADDASCTSVVRIPLLGAPCDRPARVLQKLLDEPSKLLRFLRLLLATDAAEASDLLEFLDQKPDASGSVRSSWKSDDQPLFESLVRTLEREPARLAEVDRLLRELETLGGKRAQLVPGFERLWDPVWAAYQFISIPKGRE
jgi:hypothetical protein